MPSLTIDTTVDIDAGKDAVWDVLTDFASYKEWNPVMRIEGAPEVGTTLIVHLTGAGGRGVSFRLKVLAATPGKELRWLGKLNCTATLEERRNKRLEGLIQCHRARQLSCEHTLQEWEQKDGKPQAVRRAKHKNVTQAMHIYKETADFLEAYLAILDNRSDL